MQASGLRAKHLGDASRMRPAAAADPLEPAAGSRGVCGAAGEGLVGETQAPGAWTPVAATALAGLRLSNCWPLCCSCSRQLPASGQQHVHSAGKRSS
jgi:hypothetical protein